MLQRGVNDTVEAMISLVRRLSYCNVQPYYVYMHDLVRGVEDLRTTVQTSVDIEKMVRAGKIDGVNFADWIRAPRQSQADGNTGEKKWRRYTQCQFQPVNYNRCRLILNW